MRKMPRLPCHGSFQEMLINTGLSNPVLPYAGCCMSHAWHMESHLTFTKRSLQGGPCRNCPCRPRVRQLNVNTAYMCGRSLADRCQRAGCDARYSPLPGLPARTGRPRAAIAVRKCRFHATIVAQSLQQSRARERDAWAHSLAASMACCKASSRVRPIAVQPGRSGNTTP